MDIIVCRQSLLDFRPRNTILIFGIIQTIKIIFNLLNALEELPGDARIGRVIFSKTGKSIHYGGKTFQTLSGAGFKVNYFDVDTGEYYWISGCKKDGTDHGLSNTACEPISLFEIKGITFNERYDLN
jgi:hypothetical protein